MATARQAPTLETSASLRLAEAWAALSKALAIYPETNSRVAVTVDGLFQALAAYRTGKSEIALYFQQGQVWVDGQSHEVLAKTNLAWLQDRMEKSVLAGVLIRPEVQREDVLRFTRELLAHYTRTDLELDFQRLWPETYGGIQPVERRFQGSFSGGDGTAPGGPSGVVGLSAPVHDEQVQNRLIADLCEQDAVHERLLALQERLDASASGGGGRSLDLVERIVALMPAEAMADQEKLLEIVTSVLDTLASSNAEMRGNAGVQALEDSALNNLVLTVGRRLFGRKTADEEEGEPVQAAATGRDDAVTDDLAACLAEFAALPAEFDVQAALSDLELPAETLGVHLHYFINLESLEKAKRLYPVLARTLERARPEELAVLAAYLGSLRTERAAGGDGRKLARVFEFLRAHQLTHVLRACGALAEENVIASFPLEFGQFVLSLDLAVPRELERLARVCRGVGADPLLAEAETLQREINFGDAGLAQRILAVREPAFMPLARLILEKGGPVYRDAVVAFLRKLELPADEPCLVRLYGQAADLPQDYLFAVMASTTGNGYPPSLRARVAELLCAYVRQLGVADPESPRRVYAIQLLAKFATREAKQLLSEIVGSSKYLLIHEEPRAVRRAAKAVLASIT